MTSYECEEINNIRYCEINGKINVGYGNHSNYQNGLVKDVNSAIRIPEKVLFKGQNRSVEILSAGSFASSSITYIYIPYTVTHIEQVSFIHCSKLKEIVFPENTQLEYIGQGSVFDVSTKRFWIPSSVNEISFDAFGYMSHADFYYCGAKNI